MAYSEIDGYIKDPNTIWNYLPNLSYNSPLYHELNTTELDHETYNQKMAEIIDITDEKIKSQFSEGVSSYKETQDFKTYGLIPGQRLATGNAFGKLGGLLGLSHHAVYIGNGWIFEMAPTTENKRTRKYNQVKLGLPPLDEWVDNANNKEDPIFTIDDKNIQIDSKVYIAELFERLKERVSMDQAISSQWGPLHNCESEATYLSSGKYSSANEAPSYQGSLMIRSLMIGFLTEVGGRFIKKYDSSCITKYVTENDNPCSNEVEFGILNSEATCIVEPLSKNIRKEKKASGRSNKMNRIGKIRKNKDGRFTQHGFRLGKKSKGRDKEFYQWKKCEKVMS